MEFSVVAAAVVVVVLVLTGTVIIPRLRMERRARELQVRYPKAEQTSVYLQLHSAIAWKKQREVHAKIATMEPLGWTFLRVSEASRLKTLHSLGGGLNLHFIRTGEEKNHTA